MRGFTAIEAAIAIAILGTLLAIAVPVCVREMHASKFAEPVGGLERMGARTIARKNGPENGDFPSAALTPANVPRGTMEIDPPGTWDAPGWRAIDFRATPDGVPHAFSFQMTATQNETTSDWIAQAHGDLDGDGQTSTFEIAATADASGARAVPGMYVENEIE